VGFEVFVAPDRARALWDELVEAGRPHGVAPAGLGARDTLRLEAGMPLYGHELDETISPLEAGLDWAVRLDKPDFIGKAALEDQKKNGLKQKLVGLNVGGKRIPRQGQEVFKDNKKVGLIASGTQGLWVESVIATAYVPPTMGTVGTKLQVKFKEDSYDAIVVPLPFYKRPGKK
jgi:aminomethyltransferase